MLAFVLSRPQSFGYGDVIEVCGLAVAVPEGVLVEVKQGGWVFQRHGSQTVLEEVEPLKVTSSGVQKATRFGPQASWMIGKSPQECFHSILCCNHGRWEESPHFRGA